jgi:hypothetical protein
MSLDQVAGLGTVTVLDIGTLRVADANPRRIPERAIEIVAESLRRFGWQQPLVIDTDSTVVVGHTRLYAARKLGLTAVPVVTADKLTVRELEAYRIADNRTRDYTTWDFDLLVDQLDDLSDEFADVLGLADWQSIVDDYKGAEEAAALELPSEVENALENGFQLTVFFQTKEEALAAEAEIAKLPGVFDVRHVIG